MVEHSIPTGDASPIRVPLYRLAHFAQDFLREDLETLLQQEIIESSKTPWAAPIVAVPKEDGNKRMCVDFRKVNAVPLDDPYPLQYVEDLINNIEMVVYITTLDLKKGYHQVLILKNSQEKMALITPYRKYQYTTMPFGLYQPHRISRD